MSVTKQDIKHIADLAKIGIKEDEIEPLAKDMEQIVSFVEEINKLDTSGVEPVSNVNDFTNVTRDDIVKQSLSNNDIKKNAPEFDSGHIVVPSVIE